MEELNSCTGFDWDEHNMIKNIENHSVKPEECEETFFNKPLLVKSDLLHSEGEDRYLALGQTNSKRHLFIAFTIRKHLIRAISYRDMTKKERRVYYEAKNTQI